MSKRKPTKRSSKKRRSQRDDKHGSLPPVLVAKVTGLSEEGEALAVPVKWENSKKRPPTIVLDNAKAPTIDDRVLVKITPYDSHYYLGTVLKKLPKQTAQTVVGVYQNTKRGGIIEPVNRKQKQSFYVAPEDSQKAESGMVVVAEALPHQRHKQLSLPCAKVTEILGEMENPRCYSLIAIFHQDIPVDFPAEAIAEAEASLDPVPEGRVDLRDIPLVTIDGADARDFDDAVFAEALPEGGWHLIVAIADVAHYVAIDSALDQEALKRGNSVYFPDRVVPMLPEALSNGLCSLNPHVDRYCLAVHLTIDAEGELQKYKFVRGIMRSHARLTYDQAEIEYRQQGKHYNILEPLYAAYRTLLKHREERGAMELDIPEFAIQLGKDGHVDTVSKRERFDSHKLIEEFMVTANIAAGKMLEKEKLPGVYRIHEAPPADKMEELKLFLKSMGYKLNSAPTAKDFNRLLSKARKNGQEALLSGAILRSQMQAAYLPNNLGHFGLGLTHYSHFTSPIRRYADLITHRAILHKLDTNNQTPDSENLSAVADHISQTERKAMLAEREARDRYITAFMADHGDTEFAGTITSVGNYGVFVTLNETGASGLVRISDLGRDYYHYDETLHCLTGRDSGETFQLGQPVIVSLKQADIHLGSLSFELISSTQLKSPKQDRKNRSPQRSKKKQGKYRKRK